MTAAKYGELQSCVCSVSNSEYLQTHALQINTILYAADACASSIIMHFPYSTDGFPTNVPSEDEHSHSRLECNAV